MQVRMKNLARRLGFTLMEVNLAILIMAGGVLAMVALYPLGYRESEQSQEDVKAAATADQVFNMLHGALSSRNIKWRDWEDAVKNAVGQTPKGWMSYCEENRNAYTPKKRNELNSKAQSVFSALAGAYKNGQGSLSWTPKQNYAYALVAQWGRMPMADGSGRLRQRLDHSRVALSFRCAKSAGAIFAAPIFYTEIHFQGDQEELQ